MFKQFIFISSLVSLLGFILLTYLVGNRSFFFRDYQLIDYAKTFTSPFTLNVLTAVSWPGNLPQAYYFIFITFAVLIISRKWLETIIAFVSFPTIFGLVYLIKSFISRLRPGAEIYLYSGVDMSYPSGHTVSYTVIIGYLLFLSSLHFQSRNLKIIHAIVFVLLIFLVGFSRIYIGHHWPTDVVGGFLLGYFWLSLSILIREFFHSRFSKS